MKKTKNSTRYHGQTNTKVYHVWEAMLQRCLNKKNPGYKNYGARGITVCARWLSFQEFFKDMGIPPEGSWLERTNNNANYSKINCRWASPLEQLRNTRHNKIYSIDGRKVYQRDRNKELGGSSNLIANRICKGWSEEKAISTPVSSIKAGVKVSLFVTYKNETKSLKEWASHLEISYSTLCKRLKKNWPLELVFSKTSLSGRKIEKKQEIND